MKRVLIMLATTLLPLCTSAAENPEAVVARSEVLSWLESFESLECTYRFCCDTSGGVAPVPEIIEFKVKGDWIHFVRRSKTEHAVDERMLPPLKAETNVNGQIDRFCVFDGNEVFQEGDQKFDFLGYNHLSPLSITGQNSPFSYTSFSHTLRDLLAPPGDVVLETGEDGNSTLFVFPYPPDMEYNTHVPHAVVIGLDEEDRISAMTFAIPPVCTLEEAAVFAQSPAHHLYGPVATIYMNEWTEIDGVQIPLHLRRVVWDVKYSNMQELQENMTRQEQGIIGACEGSVLRYEAISKVAVGSEQEMTIDPDSVRINRAALSREEFVIEKDPEKVAFYWNKETGDFRDYIDSWDTEADFKTRVAAQRREELEKNFGANRGNYVLLASTGIALLSLSLLFVAWRIWRKGGKERTV